MLRKFTRACFASELRKCKRMLKRNPELVNARDAPSLMTPLHVAVCCNNISLCKLLLNHGADVNALDGITNANALHYAVCQSDNEGVPLCELLISHGVDVLARATTNETPLHGALDNDEVDPDMIKVLLTQLWKATTITTSTTASM